MSQTKKEEILEVIKSPVFIQIINHFDKFLLTWWGDRNRFVRIFAELFHSLGGRTIGMHCEFCIKKK